MSAAVKFERAPGFMAEVLVCFGLALCLLCGSAAAEEFTLFGGAALAVQDGVQQLELPSGAHAQWRAPSLNTDGGTFSVWVKPLWIPGDLRSHTIATFKWSGSDNSYFALSQGWWEPLGAHKLYAVMSNQEFVFCLMPWTFDYTLFLPNQWTLLGVTWQAGNPGYVRMFVDGKIVCDRKLTFSGGRHALDPVYLGSDRAAGVEPSGRPSEMVLKDIATAGHPMSVEAMHALYLRGGGDDRPKWIQALVPVATPVENARERRVIQDEDTGWAASRLEIQRRIARVKAAGFNVYMPNVWNGARAFYRARSAPIAPTILDPADVEYDPLAYLIEIAHREGIAVHPWFIIARNPGGSVFPPSYLAGAPPDAFNLQSADFRDFIINVVADVAARYAVDGINLDYIRAMGPCSNRECVDTYAKKYGTSILADWEAQEQGKTIPSLIEWNRVATTDIVRRISERVRISKPRIVLSIDTVPFDRSRQHQGLDEGNWLHHGLIDALIFMAYDDPLDVATVDRAMQAFSPARLVVDVRDYDLYAGVQKERSGAAMRDYVRLIRARWPGAGVSFYQYPRLSADQVSILGQDSFRQAAVADWVR